MGLAMVAGNFAYGPLDRLLGTRKGVILGGNLAAAACLLGLGLLPLSGGWGSVALLAGIFANAGTLLAEDQGARERLNRAAEGVLMTLLPSAQAQLSDFIAGVVTNWDAATVTEKIELRVGRDLQYVRINGTLVGFLAGGVLFAALTALFGRVAH